ncbi:hypothetical protein [Paenibacillus dendritiformis]|uniref:hypothetical protein n=1 Tax=Paenibacillus dendritiformis TaxID=130049 RepID=UPI001110D773|nr:hypothetical protein [Paenibacillus dendritiformis]CAH8767602.1 hypothetical protein H7S4_000272 [Paenibacillus dendritiformis]
MEELLPISGFKFGTRELSNSSEMSYAVVTLDALEDSVLESFGFTTDQLLPLAATSIDKDLLVLAKPKLPSPGAVIWFAVEEIDRSTALLNSSWL